MCLVTVERDCTQHVFNLAKQKIYANLTLLLFLNLWVEYAQKSALWMSHTADMQDCPSAKLTQHLASQLRGGRPFITTQMQRKTELQVWLKLKLDQPQLDNLNEI